MYIYTLYKSGGTRERERERENEEEDTGSVYKCR